MANAETKSTSAPNDDARSVNSNELDSMSPIFGLLPTTWSGLLAGCGFLSRVRVGITAMFLMYAFPVTCYRNSILAPWLAAPGPVD